LIYEKKSNSLSENIQIQIKKSLESEKGNEDLIINRSQESGEGLTLFFADSEHFKKPFSDCNIRFPVANSFFDLKLPSSAITEQIYLRYLFHSASFYYSIMGYAQDTLFEKINIRCEELKKALSSKFYSPESLTEEELSFMRQMDRKKSVPMGDVVSSKGNIGKGLVDNVGAEKGRKIETETIKERFIDGVEKPVESANLSPSNVMSVVISSNQISIPNVRTPSSVGRSVNTQMVPQIKTMDVSDANSMQTSSAKFLQQYHQNSAAAAFALYQKDGDGNAREAREVGGVVQKENEKEKEGVTDNSLQAKRDRDRHAGVHTTHVTSVQSIMKMQPQMSLGASPGLSSSVPHTHVKPSGMEMVSSPSTGTGNIFQNVFRVWDESLDDLMFQVIICFLYFLCVMV
jgi:hypothetical protein